MTRKRRSFSAADKAAAVRRPLVDKIPVSQIADQMQVQPTSIHNWSELAPAKHNQILLTLTAMINQARTSQKEVKHDC